MSFASPLWLLLLGLIPLIVILHALSVRWRNTPVSSLVFWEEALQERTARMRLRRILGSLVLLLQVLAVTALAAALAGPGLTIRSLSSAGDTILVLDATASMQARESAGTRFDAARARGLELIAGMRRGARMAVILAARAPHLLQAFTADRAVLRRALQAAAATDEPGDVADSMTFALSLRSARRGDQVLLLSDGAFESLGSIDASRPWIHIELFGSAHDNAGITGLAFRRAAAGAAPYELFIAVRNSGQRPVTAPLLISVGGVTVVSRTVTVAPGERAALSIPWKGPTTGRVEARLQTTDAFPLDDHAYAVFAPSRQIRVRVVGASTYFTQKALSVLPGISMRTEAAPAPGFTGMSPPAGSAGAAAVDDDVTIYENVQPPPLGSARGGIILFSAVPPDLPVQASGSIERPAVTGFSRSDPLLSSVSLTGLTINRALALEPGPGFQVIAASAESPLMLTWDHAGLKVLMLAFDPQGSDLPLRAGFPVLLANTLSWFFPAWLAVQADQVQAGLPRTLATGDAAGLTVVGPDGLRRAIAATGASADFLETDRTGFYSVENGATTSEFAVNLTSDSETDITPRFVPPKSAAAESPAPPARSPIWWALAALALALFLAEWWAWLRSAGRAGA